MVGGPWARGTLPRAQGLSSQSLSLFLVTERFRSRTAVSLDGAAASFQKPDQGPVSSSDSLCFSTERWVRDVSVFKEYKEREMLPLSCC